MNAEFQSIVDQMEPLLEQLEDCNPLVAQDDLKRLPRRGVYAFYEGGEAIYVGLSNRMRERIREYRSTSSRQESATFAFKLLLDAIGDPGGHVRGRTRSELQKRHAEEYNRQKERIQKMEVRAVGIEEQEVQAVFEIYAVLALKTTGYNSFHTT